MVALVDAFVGGVKYGAGFNTEAPCDVAADRANFRGMSGVRKVAYGLGDMVGEAVNLVCLGIPELVSYNNLVDGKDDGLWYDTRDLGNDVEARKKRLTEFIARYISKHGDDSDGKSYSVGGDVAESREGNSDLEESVEGSDVSSARERMNKIIRGYKAEDYKDVKDQSYSVRDKVKGEKRGKRGKLEKSVRAVADIIKKARKDVQYGKVDVDDIYDNVRSALREYEARTGDTLDDAVLRGLDEIVSKEKGKYDVVSDEGVDNGYVEKRGYSEKKVNRERSGRRSSVENKVGGEDGKKYSAMTDKKKIYGVDIDGLGNDKLREFIDQANEGGMARSEISAYVKNFRKRDGVVAEREEGKRGSEGERNGKVYEINADSFEDFEDQALAKGMPKEMMWGYIDIIHKHNQVNDYLENMDEGDEKSRLRASLLRSEEDFKTTEENFYEIKGRQRHELKKHKFAYVDALVDETYKIHKNIFPDLNERINSKLSASERLDYIRKTATSLSENVTEDLFRTKHNVDYIVMDQDPEKRPGQFRKLTQNEKNEWKSELMSEFNKVYMHKLRNDEWSKPINFPTQPIQKSVAKKKTANKKKLGYHASQLTIGS